MIGPCNEGHGNTIAEHAILSIQEEVHFVLSKSAEIGNTETAHKDVKFSLDRYLMHCSLTQCRYDRATYLRLKSHLLASGTH
jgi:hypothetical protein